MMLTLHLSNILFCSIKTYIQQQKYLQSWGIIYNIVKPREKEIKEKKMILYIIHMKREIYI